ncbi:hypothetical protein DB30_03270 [Enhygromyxa salina]|uniref:Uncharacterized protein n=1 Tax=Enhygromyxa salina TaxID=215803 RepID=A0A0C2CUK1_9BACT|nr:hypothetical protein [Enhygromyxa salina]KIG11577.1 hypothetical protein DB30_03270 [Enhygromyxa salina]
MFEIIIAIGIIVALVVSAMVPPMSLLWISVGLGTLGAVVGLPAGFVYHAKLWRALRAEGLETGGMWLRPHHLHGRLSEPRRGPVVLWFAIGAAGFGLTMLGAGGVLMAVVRLAAH